jgi:hypothetical protein
MAVLGPNGADALKARLNLEAAAEAGDGDAMNFLGVSAYLGGDTATVQAAGDEPPLAEEVYRARLDRSIHCARSDYFVGRLRATLVTRGQIEAAGKGSLASDVALRQDGARSRAERRARVDETDPFLLSLPRPGGAGIRGDRNLL